MGNGGNGSIYHWSYGISIGWSGGYGGPGGDNNSVVVTGPGSTWSNRTDLIISQAGVTDGSGGGGVNNSVMASNGGLIVVCGSVQLGAFATGSNSQLSAVSGGQLIVTNRSGTGSINIQNGSLLVQGGVVSVNKLCATNGAASVLQFSAGLLDVGSANVADGVPFVVGDGSSSATLHLRGGTSYFADGLIIASNAVLTGTGTIYGDVKVYGTKASTLNIVPGMGGTLNATDLTWHTGGDASWFRQTLTTHDGGAALRSGAIGGG